VGHVAWRGAALEEGRVMTQYFSADGVTLYHGDCLEVMAEMAADSVDAIVTDPPYGLSFMGKNWDKGVPGEAFWAESLRVAKPGAHLLAFGGTRTFHRLAVAIEDAGWEIRDCVMWVYGSGFPKSLDVSKAMDRAAGVERELTTPRGRIGTNKTRVEQGYRPNEVAQSFNDSGPVTDSAREWSGWGTALKPAWEPIILARKPLVGTVAANVLQFGTGAINVDGCRIGDRSNYPQITVAKRGSAVYSAINSDGGKVLDNGRWPANVIHDGSDEVLALFPETESAARFFYCAKASKRDRDEGCEELRAISKVYNGQNSESAGCAPGSVEDKFSTSPAHNFHPTVKPTELMRYLCRLITPPGGIVLDPFMGSGSTGKAAALEGFAFVGIEIDEQYLEIAKARIERELLQPRLFASGDESAILPKQERMFEEKE